MTIQYVNFPAYKPWTAPGGGDAPVPPAMPPLNAPPPVGLPPVPGQPSGNLPVPSGNQPAPVQNGQDQVPAPNGVVPPDNWVPSNQPPMANNQLQQLPPGYPAPPQAGGFSAFRAAGHFLKGFVNEGVDMVKGAIQHPIQTAAIMAAGAAACFFLPWAGTAMTVAFAALGAWKMFQGWQASKADRAAGNFAKAEADFDAVGRGGFDVALAIGPSLFQRWLNKVRGQGPHVGTAEAKPSGRGGRTAKPKAPKAPKAVDPIEPPAPAEIKPARVRTRAAKPAVEVEPIAEAPTNGRAHVGSAKPKAVKPKVVKPKVTTKPKVTPAVEVEPKPVVKPEVEVTNIADKPTGGRAHVGSAKKPVAKPKAVKPKVTKVKVKPKVDPKPKPAVEVEPIAEKPTRGRAHVGSNKAAGGNPQEGHVGSAKPKKVTPKRTAPRRAKAADKATGTDDQTLRTVKGRLKAAMKEIDRLLEQ